MTGPKPVNDASMLTHRSRVRTIIGLAVLTLATSLANNFIMFWLMDWGTLLSILAALAITALPLGFGHLLYERVISERRLQIAILILIAAVAFGALFEFGQARRTVMDKAATQSVTNSYVNDATSDAADPGIPQTSEREISGTFGGAVFLITMAAEVVFGFLVGLFVKLRTDEDVAAWLTLKDIDVIIMELERKVAELVSRVRWKRNIARSTSAVRRV